MRFFKDHILPIVVMIILVFGVYHFFIKEDTASTREADEHYIKREYAEAIKIYEANRMTLSKSELIKLADSYFNNADPDKALKIYESMSKNGDITGEYLANFYLKMAQWELDIEEPELAISYYKKAIQKAQSPTLQIKAKREYSFYISENPYDAELEKAYEYMLEISKLATDMYNYDTFYRLGNFAYLLGDVEQAASYWEKCLTMNHSHIPSQEMIAMLYLQAEMFDESIEKYKGILNYESRNWRAFFGIAESYYGMGEKTKALEFYKKTIHEMPDHVFSHHQMAGIYLEQGFKNEAIIHYQKIVEKEPDSELGKNARAKLKEFGHRI